MANLFTDSYITGTLGVNGASIGRAIAAMRGAGSSSSGVLSETGDTTSTRLKVVAQGTPDMTVSVSVGDALVTGILCGLLTAHTTAAIVAPSADPRKDIVQISAAGVVTVKAGTENASPTAPTVDSGNLKLAELYLRVGATSIKNTDDSSNGYITDSRVCI